MGKELTGAPAQQEASPYLAKLYLSLLMALAYALMTRVDLSVFVVALQRWAHKPLIIHIRRLNAVVRWAQRHPLALVYKRFKGQDHLEVHADAGFRKEQKDSIDVGRAVRGATFLRVAAAKAMQVGTTPCHLLDWSCGSIKNLTRSTFTSETHAVILAVDSGMT